MNVSGKFNMFVREIGEKKIKVFETTISRKDKDGNYLDNVTVRVEFSKEFLPDEKKSYFIEGYYYPMEIITGFLSTRGYDNRDGKHVSEIVIHVTKAKTTAEPKPVKKSEKPATMADDGTIMGPDGKPLPF